MFMDFRWVSWDPWARRPTSTPTSLLLGRSFWLLWSCPIGIENIDISVSERIHWFRVRIQHFRLKPIRMRIISGSRVLMTKNWNKFTTLKKCEFLSNCNLLIPRPPLRTFKLQEKPSAFKRDHPALQDMKFLNFFLFLWVIFALLDPDPDPQTRIQTGFGNNTQKIC